MPMHRIYDWFRRHTFAVDCTLMLLLRKAHLGEVSVTVWPKILKQMCAKKNIVVLE